MQTYSIDDVLVQWVSFLREPFKSLIKKCTHQIRRIFWQTSVDFDVSTPGVHATAWQYWPSQESSCGTINSDGLYTVMVACLGLHLQPTFTSIIMADIFLDTKGVLLVRTNTPSTYGHQDVLVGPEYLFRMLLLLSVSPARTNAIVLSCSWKHLITTIDFRWKTFHSMTKSKISNLYVWYAISSLPFTSNPAIPALWFLHSASHRTLWRGICQRSDIRYLVTSTSMHIQSRKDLGLVSSIQYPSTNVRGLISVQRSWFRW